MKTVLHHYCFDIREPDQKKAYGNLRQQLEQTHAGKFFNVLADPKKDRSRAKLGQHITEEVELETKFLFNNQWNEAGDNGRRLFDWYEGIYYNEGRKNKHLKGGHWLEQTPEMIAIRRDTLTCGYCGHHIRPGEAHKWYCEKCLGSKYLTEKDLKLLRLLPVAERDDRRHYITDAERAEILPLWKEAQGLGQIAREQAQKSRNRQKVAALIPEAEKKAAELIEEANIKTKAFTWLLDHEINILDNVIFYTHTQRFGFGWREPFTPEVKSKLLDILSEFPFDYDFAKDPLRK